MDRESVEDFIRRGGKIELAEVSKFEIRDDRTFHIKKFLKELGCRWDHALYCWIAPDADAFEKAHKRLQEYSPAAIAQQTAIRSANSKWIRHDQKQHVPKAQTVERRLHERRTANAGN